MNLANIIFLKFSLELKVLPNEIQNAAQSKILTYRAGVDRHVILPGCGFHSSWSYSSKLVDVQFRKGTVFCINSVLCIQNQ